MVITFHVMHSFDNHYSKLLARGLALALAFS
jgi:hypothetical protein